MCKNYSEKFDKMRIAGYLASQTLDMLTNFIKPGISTDEIDKVSYEFIKIMVDTRRLYFIEVFKNHYAHL